MDNSRLLIVSDLHITSGKNPKTKITSSTDDFFWDDDFASLLNFYSDGIETTLIFNGDTFDFMQVLAIPTAEEANKYGIPDGDINRVYGLRCSENATAFKIDKIIAGHAGFFSALAKFVTAGNRIKFTKGNHDIELFWTKVQENIINGIMQFIKENKRDSLKDKIEFLPWFYYVPGLIYIEHGNQYEYTTSFRNFLYPYLPFDYEGTSRQVELDLSGFLVRYFSNKMEAINPLVDNIRPQSQYIEKFWKSHPFTFLTTIGTALKYVLKAFGKAKVLSKKKNKDEYEKIVKRNNELIENEAGKYFNNDPEKLKWLKDQLMNFDSMKAEPTLTNGAWRFLWKTTKPLLKNLLWIAPVYLLTFLPQLSGYLISLIEKWQPTFWRQLFLKAFQLNIAQIIIAVIFIIIVIMTVKIFKRKSRDLESDIPKKFRVISKKIADSLGVKFITFGHSHYADINRVSSGSWYFNTGTWMKIYEPKEQLYRDAQQFAFLIIENDNADLLKWNSNKYRPEEIVVMEKGENLLEKEDSLFKVFLKLIFK